MNLDNWLKVLPSLLVVGGWGIVYQLQALQARRKLLREEVEKARAAVEKLNDTALRFHMNVHSIPDRLLIVSAITDVERRCEMFPKIAKARQWYLPHAVKPEAVKIYSAYIVLVRQAITMEHFDDVNAPPLPTEAPQLSRIENSCRQLIRAIDEVLVAALD